MAETAKAALAEDSAARVTARAAVQAEQAEGDWVEVAVVGSGMAVQEGTVAEGAVAAGWAAGWAASSSLLRSSRRCTCTHRTQRRPRKGP